MNTIRKIPSSTIRNPGCLQNVDGTMTEIAADTLEALIETRFPNSQSQLDRSSNNTIWASDLPCQWKITPTQKSRVIQSFSPFIYPGPDGIIPVDRQNSLPWAVL